MKKVLPGTNCKARASSKGVEGSVSLRTLGSDVDCLWVTCLFSIVFLFEEESLPVTHHAYGELVNAYCWCLSNVAWPWGELQCFQGGCLSSVCFL